ncbi:hypothetical protein [Flavobacterium ardleyense]|uniref:hypothetical protein n=1 Tax=Flavobacterium ardleyense TaxID=2038737 RepID=UPI00298C7567|nr:hypothetical protein [Flavobacterium ardleyense]
MLELEVIIFISFSVILLLILVFVYDRHIQYADLKKKLEDPDFKSSIGSFHGGTFYGWMPLPIEDNTENEKIQIMINSHNKFVKLFWILLAMIIPLVVNTKYFDL